MTVLDDIGYNTMLNRIGLDLTRSDINQQIINAINDAIKHYARDRFYFNYTRSGTFNTVVGQSQYFTTIGNAQIADIIRIDHLFLTDSGRILELDRYEPADFEWLSASTTGSGRPVAFTYIDKTIILWPTPMAIYTMRPHMHFRPDLANSGVWFNDAEELIRTHAKLLLYTDVLEDPDGAARMQGKIQSLKDRLDYETSARTATGIIRGTDF